MDDEPIEKECNLHFEIAIGRNKDRPGLEQRFAVEKVWREMANGTADRHERDEWLSYIAKRVVSGVIDDVDFDEQDKGQAAISAIGLVGRRVVDSELLEDLDTLMGFADLLIPERKMSHREKVRSLRQRGHFQGLSDSAAVKKIQNLVQNRLAHKH